MPRQTASTPAPPTADAVRAELRQRGDPEVAAILQRFFKTGPGQYGEGDRFLGLKVPVVRGVVRAYRGLPFEQACVLLDSAFHEERLAGLLFLVYRFARGDTTERQRIYDFYLASADRINNWDLVDCSAEHIVGGHLFDRSHRPLFALARSASVWERRIALLATFHFIRRGRFDTTLALAERLRDDPHDLIHKAAGWMLREVGKRDRAAEETFLDRHAPHMPRTMLRYAIERFPEALRRRYLTARA